MTELKNYIKDYPHFPKEGILFKDMFPLLRNPTAWNTAIDQLGEFCDDVNPDCVVGIDSRGFIVGTALAMKKNLSFVPIRKKGKLPGNLWSIEYDLEYGKDILEIQKDSFTKGTRVLLVDDLLATGGTLKASLRLLDLAGANVVGCGFIIELLGLNGRNYIKDIPIKSLVSYEDT